MKKLLFLSLLLLVASGVFAQTTKRVSQPKKINISVTPGEGETRYFSLGALIDYQGYGAVWDEGILISSIWSENGQDVWFCNLFPASYSYNEAYFHGTIQGNTVFIENQDIYYWDGGQGYEGGALSLVVMKITDEETTQLPGLTLTITDQGLVLEDDEDEPCIYACLAQLNENGEIDVDENGDFSVYDYIQAYDLIALTEEQVTPAAPAEGVSMYDCALEYTYYNNETGYVNMGNKTAQLGFSGKDVYLKNASGYFEESCFKGILADDGKSFSIPSGQLSGIVDYYGTKYILFLWGLKDHDEDYFDLVDDIVFEKQDNGSWKMQSGNYFSTVSLGVGNLFELNYTMTLTPDATGIENLEPETWNLKPGTFTYNLQGQHLDKMQRGINIVDGRKVVVR